MSEQQENRPLAKLPQLSTDPKTIAVFPDQFTAYYHDNFGFRPTLIHLQALTRMKALTESSSPLVIVGKDGWLFFAGEYSATGARKVPPFTDEQLEHWRLLLEGRRQWLAKRGIRYLFTIFPRKEIIYPEYLPDRFKAAGPSRYDQLDAYLRTHSDFQILDLRPALLEAKSRRLTYYKTDGHWNFFGGLVGSQVIINELRKTYPEMRPVLESECYVTVSSFESDLVKVLGLSGQVSEDRLEFRLREPAFKSIDQPVTVSMEPFSRGVTERPDSRLPRLVLFDDSAGGSLGPYLPQNFRRAVFVWLPKLDPVLIASEKPDVVIQEMGELHLTDFLPDLTELQDLKSEGRGRQPFKFSKRK